MLENKCGSVLICAWGLMCICMYDYMYDYMYVCLSVCICLWVLICVYKCISGLMCIYI